MAEGISKTTLITGLIVAILASSALSTVVATQLGIVQGLKGDTGPQGPAGVCLPGWLPAPAFDSGWVSVSGSDTRRFAHGLNTTKVFVYLIRNTSQGLLGINDGFDPDGNGTQELRWFTLTDNDIWITTHYGMGAHEFRVMLWRITET